MTRTVWRNSKTSIVGSRERKLCIKELEHNMQTNIDDHYV